MSAATIVVTLTDGMSEEITAVSLVTLDDNVDCEAMDHEIARGEMAWVDDAGIYACGTHFAEYVASITAQ